MEIAVWPDRDWCYIEELAEVEIINPNSPDFRTFEVPEKYWDDVDEFIETIKGEL